MKNIIISMIASLMLFVSCADVEPDKYAFEDIDVEIMQAWDGKYPKFEVTVNNPMNNKIDKVVIRLLYHDQMSRFESENEVKDIELPYTGGKCVYTAKDEFPHAFTGDTYKAYAYAVVGNCIARSGEVKMVITGTYAPEVTSATFVFDDISKSNKGKVHIYGKNFSQRHLFGSSKGHVQVPYPFGAAVYSDSIVIGNCSASAYGESEITLRQYDESTPVKVTVPGLRIESLDKTTVKVREGEMLTVTVSGMRADCTYSVLGADIVSIEDGIIKCVPKVASRGPLTIIENHGTFNMWCFSKEDVLFAGF